MIRNRQISTGYFSIHSINGNNRCDKMNREFEEFFNYCEQQKFSENEMKILLKPLKFYLWKTKALKYMKIMFVLFTICASISYFDTLNWYFCAIGRLLMIKMLPLWDWRSMYNAKCLIPNFYDDVKYTTSSPKVINYNCKLCEDFERIDYIRDTSYNYIYQQYLIRGLPVLITDTFEPVSNGTDSEITKLIENLFDNHENLVNSEPCDLKTNLAMTKYTNLDELFSLILNIKKQPVDEQNSWYLSFRNCDFKAVEYFVKSSRLLLKKKPYFYPRNLQPPYTSSLIMSNYNASSFNIHVQGFIIITQMTGSVIIKLQAKKECYKACGEHELQIFSGESLAYLSDLWDLSYHQTSKDDSITFVSETHFN
ncbi:unnamed protein product [Diamesa tonsa]